MQITRLKSVVGLFAAGAALMGVVRAQAPQGAVPVPAGAREGDRPGGGPPAAKAIEAPAPPEFTEAAILRPFGDRAWYAVFSPDGKSLVAGTNTSGAVRVYDVAGRKELAYLGGEPRTNFACAAFSPDGKTLATGGGVRVLVWDFASRSLTARFTAHTKGVRSLAFSPDGQTLASASDDGYVKMWEAGTWKERPGSVSAAEPVMCVAFSPDGRTLALGTGDYREARPPRVALYDFDGASAKERATLPAGTRGPAWTVAFSPDGRTLASCSNDPEVKLWDPSSGRVSASLPLPKGSAARGLAFAPDGKTLAAGLGDGGIALWEVASGKRVATLRGHKQHLFTVAISPDGTTLAGASRDGSVSLWDLAKIRP